MLGSLNELGEPGVGWVLPLLTEWHACTGCAWGTASPLLLLECGSPQCQQASARFAECARVRCYKMPLVPQATLRPPTSSPQVWR